ncbi:hypothetical protein BDM02DRAFT_3189181 [Thelephora ganbajun]|uniref:Uncharacterized protein n=1 Tax=Thelephora ganbajun TaxID=370292 RepID=A0ACB6Z9V0_THEGA|nr:hypothetical protein BDM02DRAFT_3189181 [Thelephora ganbajun]
MSDFREILCDLVKNLSEGNYDKSFAQYRFWLDIGTAHGHINGQDQVRNDIGRILQSELLGPDSRELIHPTAHLFFRFVGDVKADEIMSGHVSGLEQSCAGTVNWLFGANLSLVNFGNMQGKSTRFLTEMNLFACWANLGYVEEVVIRNRILQSLISHPKLYDHQADALIILFKLAGATFGAYTDPSVVDRCFELLKNHYSRDSNRGRLVQEVVELRECGWKGLPPPPVFTAGIPKPTGANQNDPAATPAPTSLGLPNADLEPQIPRPSPLEPVTILATDMIPGSLVTHSPSISIASLSDFTVADDSDDESPVDISIDADAQARHETFYLEDGNVEVLCGNTVFRVHTSILSFHSPALRRMFAQTNLARADSPSGCPRILSSDPAADFATLLKMIYLPGFPEKNKVPDFATFSSLLRITTKYEMPTVRSQLLEVVRDAYPETFEGLDPSEALGETAFGGQTPHPNAVLNLFVQQKLTSVLPMAYYMAVRRGLDSLMDARLPASTRLSSETLQTAVKGLIALREMELKETQRLIYKSKISRPYFSSDCPSCNATGPKVSDAYQNVVDRMPRSGTNVLQVLSLSFIYGENYHGFCKGCVGEWESGHVEVRRKAWAALPIVFGLRG